MIEQFQSWVDIQKKIKMKTLVQKGSVPQCSQQNYLQQPRNESNPHTPQQIVGLRTYSLYMQWDTTQP